MEEVQENIILEMDEKEEKRRTEREEMTKMDRTLQTVGEKIRKRAVAEDVHT